MSAPAAILATAVVPWTDRYEFDEDRFCRQVHTIARGLTRHLYVFGTAGEGYAVTEKQFDRIAAAFWRSAQECAASPMLGVVSLSLPTILERIGRGHALGFREFQISLPSWGALNDRELDTFFAETCGRFPDSNFHHYNLLRTKRLLTAVEYRRLAAAHPNFVAVKSSTDDPAILADLLTVSPRLRFFFTEFGYAIARRTHDVGFLISLASVNYARAAPPMSPTSAPWSPPCASWPTAGSTSTAPSTSCSSASPTPRFHSASYRLTRRRPRTISPASAPRSPLAGRPKLPLIP